MRLTIDTTATTRYLASYRKQFTFAVSKMLNRLATHFQLVERQHIRAHFILRRATFILNTVKIERGGFATKSKLFVDVGIDPTRDVLSKFEEGGTKKPRGQSLAVPVAVRRSLGSVVPNALRPRALGLQRIPTTTGTPVYHGLKRTYLIETASGQKLIFQRTSRSRTRLLYALEPSAHIQPDLKFEVNARAVGRFRAAPFFAEEMTKALATAR